MTLIEDCALTEAGDIIFAQRAIVTGDCSFLRDRPRRIVRPTLDYEVGIMEDIGLLRLVVGKKHDWWGTVSYSEKCNNYNFIPRGLKTSAKIVLLPHINFRKSYPRTRFS